MKKCLEHL